jgi:hypothetical protein
MPVGLCFASQSGIEYHEAEKDLNDAYQKVLSTVTDPQQRSLLVAAQRSWIKYREAEAAFHARYFPASKRITILTEMAVNRAAELEALLTPEAKEQHEDPFSEGLGAINMAKWNETPCVSGRLATKQDVEEGRATFYYPQDKAPVKIPLPLCAIHNDPKSKESTPVIVIQVEETPKGKRAGYRSLLGLPGSCPLSELEILNGPDKRFK